MLEELGSAPQKITPVKPRITTDAGKTVREMMDSRAW
jgi:hypothetical protein